MRRGTWSVQDAKNRFSEVVEAAHRTPQMVTKHGKPAVVVVDAKEYERLRHLGRTKAPLLCRTLAGDAAGWRQLRAPEGATARSQILMYLIDTVTLSELRRRRRDTRLVAWFERQRTVDLFVSVISIGEIERGIAAQRASNPGFAAALARWLDTVLALYGERILPFDLSAARRWGLLSAALGNESAATALEHGLTVVTRNVADFAPAHVPVLNPFQPPQPRSPE